MASFLDIKPRTDKLSLHVPNRCGSNRGRCGGPLSPTGAVKIKSPTLILKKAITTAPAAVGYNIPPQYAAFPINRGGRPGGCGAGFDRVPGHPHACRPTGLAGQLPFVAAPRATSAAYWQALLFRSLIRK
jgi:hypothetical protein